MLCMGSDLVGTLLGARASGQGPYPRRARASAFAGVGSNLVRRLLGWRASGQGPDPRRAGASGQGPDPRRAGASAFAGVGSDLVRTLLGWRASGQGPDPRRARASGQGPDPRRAGADPPSAGAGRHQPSSKSISIASQRAMRAQASGPTPSSAGQSASCARKATCALGPPNAVTIAAGWRWKIQSKPGSQRSRTTIAPSGSDCGVACASTIWTVACTRPRPR